MKTVLVCDKVGCDDPATVLPRILLMRAGASGSAKVWMGVGLCAAHAAEIEPGRVTQDTIWAQVLRMVRELGLPEPDRAMCRMDLVPVDDPEAVKVIRGKGDASIRPVQL